MCFEVFLCDVYIKLAYSVMIVEDFGDYFFVSCQLNV